MACRLMTATSAKRGVLGCWIDTLMGEMKLSSLTWPRAVWRLQLDYRICMSPRDSWNSCQNTACTVSHE